MGSEGRTWHQVARILGGLSLVSLLFWWSLQPGNPDFAEWRSRVVAESGAQDIVAERSDRDWFVVVGRSPTGDGIAVASWFRGTCKEALCDGEYHIMHRIQTPNGESLISVSDEGKLISRPLATNWFSGGSQLGELLVIGMRKPYHGNVVCTSQLVRDAASTVPGMSLPSVQTLVVWP